MTYRVPPPPPLLPLPGQARRDLLCPEGCEVGGVRVGLRLAVVNIEETHDLNHDLESVALGVWHASRLDTSYEASKEELFCPYCLSNWAVPENVEVEYA